MRRDLLVLMLIPFLTSCRKPEPSTGLAPEMPKVEPTVDVAPIVATFSGSGEPGSGSVPVIPNSSFVKAEVISFTMEELIIRLISVRAIEGPPDFLSGMVGQAVKVYLRKETPFDLPPGLLIQAELVMEGDEHGQHYILKSVSLP